MKKILVYIVQKIYDIFVLGGGVAYMFLSKEEMNRRKLGDIFMKVADIEESIATSGMTGEMRNEVMILRDKLAHIDTTRYKSIRNHYIEACDKFSDIKEKDAPTMTPKTK